MNKQDMRSQMESTPQAESVAQARVGRRAFLSRAGMVGIGVAATGFAMADATPARAQSTGGRDQDTVKEILTAILIAEDLATTFYYNALVGTVIEDMNLAGPGGTAMNVTAAGNAPNVAYVRAALSEEISHATLARTMLRIPSAAADPAQTFYFPAKTFDTLAGFTGLLDALENAFIGAYLNAIQEFATKAARAVNGTYTDLDGQKYTAAELEYASKVAASIMGIEAEHRVLGRVISNTNPANNLAYEQLDGINAVYNGPKSAVAALTPFLTSSTGPGFSLATALANQKSVSLPVVSNPPAPF